jgi:hypothetical protein
VEGGGVAGCVAAGEVDSIGDIDDIDIPPPQALKVAIRKEHAAGTHRRRVTHALFGRFVRCMTEPLLHVLLHMSADPRLFGYILMVAE